MQTLKTRDLIALGFMTFALFLGAGNIIFPPMVGQGAGEHAAAAATGFLLTGVGLPLLTVVALARVGGGLDALTSPRGPQGRHGAGPADLSHPRPAVCHAAHGHRVVRDGLCALRGPQQHCAVHLLGGVLCAGHGPVPVPRQADRHHRQADHARADPGPGGAGCRRRAAAGRCRHQRQRRLPGRAPDRRVSGGLPDHGRAGRPGLRHRHRQRHPGTGASPTPGCRRATPSSRA